MRVFRDELGRFVIRFGLDRPNVQCVVNKDARGCLPGMAAGEFDTGARGDSQRFQASLAQIIMENALIIPLAENIYYTVTPKNLRDIGVDSFQQNWLYDTYFEG